MLRCFNKRCNHTRTGFYQPVIHKERLTIKMALQIFATVPFESVCLFANFCSFLQIASYLSCLLSVVSPHSFFTSMLLIPPLNSFTTNLGHRSRFKWRNLPCCVHSVLLRVSFLKPLIHSFIWSLLQLRVLKKNCQSKIVTEWVPKSQSLSKIYFSFEKFCLKRKISFRVQTCLVDYQRLAWEWW